MQSFSKFGLVAVIGMVAACGAEKPPVNDATMITPPPPATEAVPAHEMGQENSGPATSAAPAPAAAPAAPAAAPAAAQPAPQK